MTIDIDELRRLAQAATPGGWYVEAGNYIYGCKEVTDGEEEWHPVIACTDDNETNVDFEANAAFIAAANPAAVEELLDRLEAAEKERDDVAQQLVQAEIGKRKLDAERDALRDKIEAMERQEPVGKAGSMPGASGFTMACFRTDAVPFGSNLYGLPGAKGE